MTMVPSSSQNGKPNTSSCDTKSAMNQVGVEGYYYNCLGSDFLVSNMAEEDESRAHTSTHHNEAEAEAEGGSISKEEEKGNNNNNNNSNSGNWLQLSIGSSCHQSHSATVTNTDHHHQLHQMAPITSSGGLVELDLLPGNRSHNSNRPSSSSHRSLDAPTIFPARSCQGGSSFGASSLLFEQTSMSMSMPMSMSMSMSMAMPSGPFSIHQHQQQHHQQQHPQEMMNWAFGPLPHSMAIMPSSSFITTTNSSSSSSLLQSSSSLRHFSSPPLGSCFPTPFHHFPSSSSSSSALFDQFDHVAGPSSDVTTTIRVVDPPRRPQSGLWFMLQASQNQ
ncbi:hypothetical protein RIF29_14203 [Crotalaria pallida]|uniref:Uncharacterized protein n=1 Tax=Crotalaria pallida TaxID=3830 RepID=A0AAN9FCZ9_CROPI